MAPKCPKCNQAVSAWPYNKDRNCPGCNAKIKTTTPETLAVVCIIFWVTLEIPVIPIFGLKMPIADLVTLPFVLLIWALLFSKFARVSLVPDDPKIETRPKDD